jgi:hypothetical protein
VADLEASTDREWDLPLIDLLERVMGGGMPLAAFSEESSTLGIDKDAVFATYFKVTGSDVIASAAGLELVADHRRARSTGSAARPSTTVRVTRHAIDRASTRHRLELDRSEIEHGIEAEVKSALAAGRRANHKPEWWPLMYGEKRTQLPAGDWFVWSADCSRAWIISKRERHWLVITSLSRV